MIRKWIDTHDISDYRLMLRAKRLPVYRFVGRWLEVPDEYAGQLGISNETENEDTPFVPSPWLFDYQRDIAALAIAKRKFAVFADCGLGKTLIELEFARHVHASHPGRPVLIVTPLMVVPQMVEEAGKFYGDGLPVEDVSAAKLQAWFDGERESDIGITNWDALREGLSCDNLAGLILDESSMLKSHYGKFGQRVIALGKGVPYKLAATGTPAPNDRIEYANHSVFLDVHRSTNEFLARYFVNRGQTQNRWEIKPHALKPFYRDLSHWCIFLSNPATYGWKDNSGTIPPIRIHIDTVPMTDEQKKSIQRQTGCLVAGNIGGISQRSKLSQIAKGGNKPEFIRDMIDSWPNESTIVWCRYNAEQDTMRDVLGDRCVSVTGSTKYEDRVDSIQRFKAGEVRVLLTKPKILGFGLNLQVATRQVFSTCQDSYEEFYQAVKRSNRVGSTKPLDVHLPVSDVEEPMMQNVLRKASRVEADTAVQEQLFSEMRFNA